LKIATPVQNDGPPNAAERGSYQSIRFLRGNARSPWQANRI